MSSGIPTRAFGTNPDVAVVVGVDEIVDDVDDFVVVVVQDDVVVVDADVEGVVDNDDDGVV